LACPVSTIGIGKSQGSKNEIDLKIK